MCAEYTLRTSGQKILKALGISAELPAHEWDIRVRVHGPAPVVHLSVDKSVHIDEMGFSLKPPGTKYPTFNARLASWDERVERVVLISEKPTWKTPLTRARCLVPMSAFVEPVYRGENAGRMVMFRPRPGEILFGAGIYEESVDKKTGEVYSGFALILHTPSDFIIEHGHHRQPVFLESSDALRWIESSSPSGQAAVDFLLKNRYLPELSAEPDRPMAKGWEKRVADSNRKLESELDFMEKLKSQGY